MKFTADQIEFLLTKMSLEEIEESKTFVPTVKPVCSSLKKNGEACKNKSTKDGVCNVHSVVREVKVKKPVSEEDKCCFVKKDGVKCVFRKKNGEFCGRHTNVQVSSSDSE